MAIFKTLRRLLRRDKNDRLLRFRVRVPNMRRKKLRSGEIAFYWQAPEYVKRLGIPLHSEPLGTDLKAAVTRAAMLNRQAKSFYQKRTKKPKKSTRVPIRKTSIPSSIPVTATGNRPASAVTARANSAVTEAASIAELEDVF